MTNHEADEDVYCTCHPPNRTTQLLDHHVAVLVTPLVSAKREWSVPAQAEQLDAA
jgi:hypothetical protein